MLVCCVIYWFLYDIYVHLWMFLYKVITTDETLFSISDKYFSESRNDTEKFHFALMCFSGSMKATFITQGSSSLIQKGITSLQGCIKWIDDLFLVSIANCGCCLSNVTSSQYFSPEKKTGFLPSQVSSDKRTKILRETWAAHFDKYTCI